MIYLASPYSNPPPGSTLETRFNAVLQHAALLMEQGETVFCPIAHSHPIADWLPSERRMDHEFWMKQDLPILRACDKLVVLMLPGWEKSRGVREETAEARRWSKSIEWHAFAATVDQMQSPSVTWCPGDVWPWYEGESPLAHAARFISNEMDFNLMSKGEVLSGKLGDVTLDDAIKAVDSMTHKESILEEAQRLVHGARQADYGHPLDDFGKVTRMAHALWGRGPQSAEEHALYMCLVKIARQVEKPKRDNLVDLAGYAATAQMIVDALSTPKK
jgi:hypothetical protein